MSTNRTNIDSLSINFEKKAYFINDTGFYVSIENKNTLVPTPYIDQFFTVVKRNTTIVVIADKFYLEFGSGAFNLVSCETNKCGVCKSNESKPLLSKYLRSDQYLVNNTCMTCRDGYYFSSGSCFKAFPIKNDIIHIDEARSGCEADKASLAILNTDSKFEFVKLLVEFGYAFVFMF